MSTDDMRPTHYDTHTHTHTHYDSDEAAAHTHARTHTLKMRLLSTLLGINSSREDVPQIGFRRRGVMQGGVPILHEERGGEWSIGVDEQECGGGGA